MWTSKRHQCPLYWPFVRGNHWWPVNSPHKGSVTRKKKRPCDDVIICWLVPNKRYSSAGWSLQWRHYKRLGVSDHQPHDDCLLGHLFRRRSRKTSKLHVTGLCAGNSPVTGEFPIQRASNAENISIWWRHHVKHHCYKSIGVVQISNFGTSARYCLQFHRIIRNQRTFHWLRHGNDIREGHQKFLDKVRHKFQTDIL